MSNEEKKVTKEDLREELKEEQMPEETEAADAENTEEAETAEETAETQEEAKGESCEEQKAADSEEEAWSAKYVRLMADFQNYKKRVEQEKGDIYAYANEKLVTELLTVIDNFDRALAHECADESFVEGMRMIFKQLSGVLEKAGLEEINALGEDFDPNYHNAVMMEDNDAYESGKVTNVMQKGYMLNKKVIRPAMVSVNN